ncbi:MAG: hypothetical protein RIS54_273 [Verrucomicrobiota bacterium]|jgi:DNA-binding response OmpR family regulator
MPHLSGCDLVIALRRQGFRGHICVCSAVDRMDIRRIYADLAIDAVVQKPFTLAQLRALVKGFLAVPA